MTPQEYADALAGRVPVVYHEDRCAADKTLGYDPCDCGALQKLCRLQGRSLPSQEPDDLEPWLEQARTITEGWTGIEMLSADETRRIVMAGRFVEEVTQRIAVALRAAARGPSSNPYAR